MRARLRGEEEGAALVMALVFLSLFGTFVAVLLSFAETSFRATLAVREQGSAHYAADGAIDGAIDRLRSDIDTGREGDDFTCFTAPPTNGVVASVRCQGQDGSGEGSSQNAPSLAMLSLAPLSSGEDGIVRSSNAELSVQGDVFSNSTIVVSGSSPMSVDGSVTSRGACDAERLTTTRPPLACDIGSAPDPDGDDPDYAPLVAEPPVHRAVPSCGSGWLVEFQPGTYDDAVALTDLMDGGCAGKVFLFEPGAYYFDFRTPDVSHTWRIDDADLNLVGGAPQGWSTSASARPALPHPGACDTAAGGVQFIFGGDSRWVVNDGTVELCAQPSTTEQQIAVYGLKSGSSTSSTATRAPAAATSLLYVPATEAVQIDGTSAAATVPASLTGALTWSGFEPVPAGSLITAATLHVAHRDSNSATSSSTSRVSSVRATLTPGSGDATTVDVPLHGGALTTDSIDLLAAGLSPTADLTSFTLTYAATAKASGSITSRLDGATLEVTYAPPAFEAASGCLTVRPYTGVGDSCALLSTGNTNSARLAIHGTVYAPTSAVDLRMTNVAAAAIDRGLIAWVIRLAVTPATSISGAIIGIPNDGGGRADRVVLLTARVGSTDRIRALVTFSDGGGSTPGETVEIDSWSVLR